MPPAEMIEITDAGVFASAYNKVVGKLAYTGDGTWAAQGVPIAYFDFGSWKDDRFKFQFTTLMRAALPEPLLWQREPVQFHTAGRQYAGRLLQRGTGR